jgi:hypothetical protein
MLGVLGFTGVDGGGAPRQIVPEPGDMFTLIDQVGYFEENDEATFSYEEGATLTFGAQPLQWEELPAPPGEYFVGFVVEDLDGNIYEDRVSVTVE